MFVVVAGGYFSERKKAKRYTCASRCTRKPPSPPLSSNTHAQLNQVPSPSTLSFPVSSTLSPPPPDGILSRPFEPNLAEKKAKSGLARGPTRSTKGGGDPTHLVFLPTSKVAERRPNFPIGREIYEDTGGGVVGGREGRGEKRRGIETLLGKGSRGRGKGREHFTVWAGGVFFCPPPLFARFFLLGTRFFWGGGKGCEMCEMGVRGGGFSPFSPLFFFSVNLLQLES